MSERLSPSQMEIARRNSKALEKAWRIWNRPRGYSLEEVRKASKYLLDQKKNFEVNISMDVSGLDPEIYDRVYMGIFHYDITPPLEYKFKFDNRN